MNKVTIAALVIALSASAGAFADKPQKPDKKQDKAKAKSGDKAQNKAQNKNKGGDSHGTVVFGSSDREAARAYFSQKYGRGNCPPGLAKKNNGCLPPGQAKKRYRVGERLSANVVYIEAPSELVVRLQPISSGHRYVIVDGDLVKLVIGTLLVVDALDGLIN
jgi:hypothetical protein